MNQTEDKIIKTLGITAGLAILIMIGMTLVVATYSVIVADDFYYAQNVGKNTGTWSYLKQCFQYVGRVYMEWQGTYSAEFIAAILNPVNRHGFDTLRWIMIANVFVFYGALLILVDVVLKRIIPENRNIRVVIMALVVFVMAEYDAFPEIFNWYVGATVYSVPLSFGLLALALFVVSNSNGKYVVLSGIFGFIAAGGSLAISGTLCYLMLMLVLYYWIRDRKLAISNAVMFGCSFAGSLINAAAPGNFLRQGAESSLEFDLGTTVENTIQVYVSSVRWLFEQRNFGAVLAVAVVCGLYISQKKGRELVAWIVVSILSLFTAVVTIFPVVMGYNVPWMPNRCVFVSFTAFGLTFINMALVTGSVVSGFIKNTKTSAIVKIILIAIALLLVLISPYEIRSYKSARHLKALIDHKYQDNYEMTRELLEGLHDHAGEDVVVNVPTTPDDIENYYSFYLIDKDNWINRAVAWSYDLKSIDNEAN